MEGRKWKKVRADGKLEGLRGKNKVGGILARESQVPVLTKKFSGSGAA
jgi:hypothetical protein